MSKILAVFGATGQQGSSVINNVLNDPQLSKEYTLRAITRDVNSDKAAKLKQRGNIQVVQGDVSDPSSLKTALADVHTVFIMTTPDLGPNGLEVEFNAGKTAADAAVEQGVKYIIFSTLPNTSVLSEGKCVKVTPFDAKAEIEKYIRTLPVRSAFTSFGFFMENWISYFFLNPKKASDGTYELLRPTASTIKVPFLAAVADIGKFVGAVLAEPDKFAGKTVLASQANYSWDEIVAIISKVTGKKVVFKRVSPAEFSEQIPFFKDAMGEGYEMLGVCGYYGPDTEDEVKWAAQNARGRLTTLEEFLTANPLQLE